MTEKTKFETTSFSLHIMAMLFMLCDHLWGTVVNGNDWLTCIGRLTFPIYAFMIVEGYFHTKDLKKYGKRSSRKFHSIWQWAAACFIRSIKMFCGHS